MSRLRLAVVILAALGLSAACSSDPGPEIPKSTAYVALGDSYVAGSGISSPDPESASCLRSNHNYPTLVAAQIKPTEFTDVSCAGATTESLMNGAALANGTAIDPQLTRLGGSTRLVTIGIGGNDGAAAAGLAASCLAKETQSDAKCKEFASTYMPTVFPTTAAAVDTVLSQVKSRAPKARIIFTGYLRVVPDQGTCADLPLSPANQEAALAYEKEMNATLLEAARRAKVTYVDVYALSAGHDACAAAAAWVNGIVGTASDGVAVHPNAAGEKAVADAVLQAIKR